jgi:beta-glucosidase
LAERLLTVDVGADEGAEFDASELGDFRNGDLESPERADRGSRNYTGASMVCDSVVDERTLREIYLTAFEIVVREAAPWTVMSSYNLVNGTYAHENAHLLLDLLRNAWGFDGVVVSDWGGSNDAVAAVSSGGTLEMPSPGFDSVRQIVAAVESGTLSVADLDARVSEVVDLVRRVTARPAVPVDLDAHHALATTQGI